MPELFKRIYIQAGTGTPAEKTNTLSSVSNQGHYISLRPFVNPKKGEFPMEWAFAGTKDHIKVTPVDDRNVKQDFNFWLNSQKYLKVPNSHEGEVNTNWYTWDTGCVEETGTIYPFGKDKEGVFFHELWQPLQVKHTEEVIANSPNANKDARSIVLQTDASADYEGLVVVVGRWVQGYLSLKNGNDVKGLNAIRLLEQTEGNEDYKTLFEYGVDTAKFPVQFNNLKNGRSVEVNGLKWNVIEA